MSEQAETLLIFIMLIGLAIAFLSSGPHSIAGALLFLGVLYYEPKDTKK